MFVLDVLVHCCFAACPGLATFICVWTDKLLGVDMLLINMPQQVELADEVSLAEASIGFLLVTSARLK